MISPVVPSWTLLFAWILLILSASWANVTAVIEIAAAIQLRKYISGEWLLVVIGIISILFGAALLYNPAAEHWQLFG